MPQTPRLRRFKALGTIINLTVWGECDAAALDAAVALVQAEETRLTVNRPQSEVMAVNHAAGAAAQPVSTNTYALIKRAVAASRENMGFNALIGPLVKLWAIGFAGANVPAAADIAERQTLCDPTQVAFDDAAHAVRLGQPGMELDLGGIAKGAIADQIAALWQAYGVAAGIIDLGGNLVFVGASPHRPDGRWVIGVQDPQAKRHTDVGRTILPACSAVTSGIYERFLIKDGKQYHHLLDGRTGYPLQTVLSGVTVFCAASVVAEVEAKRLFFAGAPLPGWAEQPGHLGAVFVYQDGRVVTDGIELHQ